MNKRTFSNLILLLYVVFMPPSLMLADIVPGLNEYQSIPTDSAMDWEAFTIDGNTYLAVANSYNGSSHNIDSKIYKWNGISFAEYQSIPTNSAMDWEAFTIDAIVIWQ